MEIRDENESEDSGDQGRYEAYTPGSIAPLSLGQDVHSLTAYGHPQPVVSYTNRSFASEKDLRIWVAQEFGGLVNIHGKKYWKSGDNLAKYKSWTCSCKHEKKANCKFKLYIAWTNKSVGPVIKTSHAVHTGHQVDIHDRRHEFDGEYPGLREPGISEEVYAKIITSMQNRENQCKRKLAYNHCIQSFEKFLTRELELAPPAGVRRKVNDFIAAASTPEPQPTFHV